MQYLAPGVSEWPGGRIPDYVRELTTIAIAVISRDGQLVDANVGFSNLLPDAMAAVDMLDVRDLFAKPSFDRLVTRRRERSYGTLYSGIFNFGRIESGVTSLQGKLYTLGGDLLLVAEQQVAGLELLRARVLRLSDELIEQQRKLANALNEAKRHKRLAEQAARERNALFEKMAP